MRKFAILVGMVLLALQCVAGLAGAAGPGEFVPTGSMNTARSGAAVAKLPDGRVLVAGGLDSSSNFVTSAEIYDPSTGTFSNTGSMDIARALAMAVTLNNGRVLVTGGVTSPIDSTTASEIYDPATGTFSDTASLGTARSGTTATLLSNGWVFIAGGRQSAFGPSLATSTFYDPEGGILHTGSFTGSGPMNTARDSAAQALLPDDKVLVAGGQSSNVYGTSAEVWSRANGLFSTTGSMSTAHANPASATLSTGKVLVAGGYSSGSSITGTSELYSPAAGTFSDTGSLNTPRALPEYATLKDGRMLVAGGSANGVGNYLSSAEIYDPATGTFTLTGSMASPRWSGSAVTLNDGRVLVLSGLDATSHRLGTAELFYPNGAPTKLSVTKDGAGSGIVTSDPAGINCGADCSADFGRGDVVKLTASATAGSKFVGWSGACSGTGSCQVTVNQATSVGAKFDKAPPVLALKVKPSSKSVSPGGKAKFTVKTTNTGGSSASSTKVCVKVTKSRVKAGKCQSLGTLAPGKGKSASFMVEAKPKARPGKTKLTFTATGKGAVKKTAKASLKIRR